MRSLLFCVFIASLFSATLYVSPNGSDNNGCTQSAPCKTINATVNKAGSNATINLENGTYDSWQAPILISESSGDDIVGRGTSSTTGSVINIITPEPLFILTPNAKSYLTLSQLRLLYNTNRTATTLAVGSGNVGVNVTNVVVTQGVPDDNTTLSGVDFISLQGGNLVISNTLFDTFNSNTYLFFIRKPAQNNVTFNNVNVTNLVVNNALLYDYGWNENFANTIITASRFNNITSPDPRQGPGGGGGGGGLAPIFGDPHPGIIDVDLVYSGQKVFNVSNTVFSQIRLNFMYNAPVYFSVEWEIRRSQIPTFSFRDVTFQSNQALECGGIAVNTDVTKDFVRLEIISCRFYDNSEMFDWPGAFSDLYLGGPTRSNSTITGTCSLSCSPRVDDLRDVELLGNCSSGQVPTDPCRTYAKGGDYYVNSTYNTPGDDDNSCTSNSNPCETVQGAVMKGTNSTIHVGVGYYNCPTVFINVMVVGYKFVGLNAAIGDEWNLQTHIDIGGPAGPGGRRGGPGFFFLQNYADLYLSLDRLHFMWLDERPDLLVLSESMRGQINITDVEFSQGGNIEIAIRVVFFTIIRGNLVMNNVRFAYLESAASIIEHIGRQFNVFNATQVNFTNIQLSNGFAHIFDDIESEQGALLFNWVNVTVENVTRERSYDGAYNHALLEFSGTDFGADFTPGVSFFNCTFRHNFIPSDSLILFDVPKEPIFINCTFTNNTARYAGAITAVATGAYVRLYNCSFYANRGSFPGESFSDLNIGNDALDYVPQDIFFTCSRSCMPRTAMELAFSFPNCTEEADYGGFGKIDPTTDCPPFGEQLYVNITGGNDTNRCSDITAPCATIYGAYFKGMANRIRLTGGDFQCNPIVVTDTQGALLIQGATQFGDNNTRTTLEFGLEQVFTLKDYPGVFLGLEFLRMYMNAAVQSFRFMIHIDTRTEWSGTVEIREVVVNHAANASGCNFISMNSGRVFMWNVLFHNLSTYGPIVLCLNHFAFRENTLMVHNCTMGNVTLNGAGPIFDSGGFYHENFTLLLIENFTATLELNRTFSGLFMITDDCDIFNFTSSTLRNLNLSVDYQAPIVFHSITETRELFFINNTFTNNIAEFSGGVMVHETASIKMRIVFCQFYNNSALNARGVADIFFNWDHGLYTPFDVIGTCSRSCWPRVNRGRQEILPPCLNESDWNGKGGNNFSTCDQVNSALLFVNGTNGDDSRNCLNWQQPCKTIAGALGKGWNNEIIIETGTYEVPTINITGNMSGYTIQAVGFNQTFVNINTDEVHFDLGNAPGVFVFLDNLTFVQNIDRTTYLITCEAQFDFHNLIEVSNVIFTQGQQHQFSGFSFIRFTGGDVFLRNVLFDGLVGRTPLIHFVSQVPFEFGFPYLLNLNLVNITNIKLTGDRPLYMDDDNDHTHMNVGMENCRVEHITTNGTTSRDFGLFNFQSNATGKSVDIIGSSFRYLNLGNVYTAPIHFKGNFGPNRAFMNTTFSHNYAQKTGGVFDEDEDLKIRFIICRFFDNHYLQPGGASDLYLGPLSDTYTWTDIIASCGNSGGPKISTTNQTINGLITYCEEPVPASPEVKIVEKKKVSAGAVVAIVVLVLLVVAAATVGIIIFLWYRKKKQQGYEFIGPGQKDKGVNNADFDVEGRK